MPTPDRAASEVDVRRLAGSEAVRWLLAFPRVLGWCRPDVLSRDFAMLSKLATTIPVYDVTIPWGPPFRDDIAATLADLVR